MRIPMTDILHKIPVKIAVSIAWFFYAILLILFSPDITPLFLLSMILLLTGMLIIILSSIISNDLNKSTLIKIAFGLIVSITGIFVLFLTIVLNKGFQWVLILGIIVSIVMFGVILLGMREKIRRASEEKDNEIC
jgi:hypothetical protein